MKTIIEYIQKKHIAKQEYSTPTIPYNDTFESWISEYKDNGWTDYDITHFLTKDKTDGIDLNLYFEKSQEYLHLRRLFNKGSNNEYALCMIYDCDEVFPKDSEWNHEGHCITIWRLNVNEDEEDLFELFINGITTNLYELTK